MRPDASTLRRPFLTALVASLTATALLAIVALLAGEFGDTEARIVLTTASLSVCSLFALPGSVLLDQGRRRPMAALDVGGAAITFVAALVLIWPQWDDPAEASWKTLVVLAAVTGALAQACGVESRRRPDDSSAATRLAITSHGSVAVVAGLVSVAAIAEVDDGDYYRWLAAVAVANVLFVVLQPIARRFAASAIRRRGHRLVCVLSGPPGSLPPKGYRARREAPATIDCEVGGVDFAAAAATAIRELERDGTLVLRVERAEAMR